MRSVSNPGGVTHTETSRGSRSNHTRRPNHPEYPSAHACHTTAIAEALESFFGPGRLRFSIDSLVTGETRHYNRFKEVVSEVNNARVWAGFHFRYAQDDGSRLGRQVARFVVRNFFQPLE